MALGNEGWCLLLVVNTSERTQTTQGPGVLEAIPGYEQTGRRDGLHVRRGHRPCVTVDSAGCVWLCRHSLALIEREDLVENSKPGLTGTPRARKPGTRRRETGEAGEAEAAAAPQDPDQARKSSPGSRPGK